MPTLSESLNTSLEGYEPVQSSSNPLSAANATDLQPGASGFSRGPLPILSSSSPDNLRTFYLGARVLQNRLYNIPVVPAAPVTVQNVTNVTNQTFTQGSSTDGFTSGQNSNGFWAQDPTGLIRQWGTITVIGGGGPDPFGTMTFPTPFTSSDYAISGNANACVNGTDLTNSGDVPIVCFDNFMPATARWRLDSNKGDSFGNVPFSWIAIGY